MKIVVAVISARGAARGAAGEMLRGYIERCGRLGACEVRAFGSERALLEFVAAAAGRTRPRLVVADSRGDQVTSEEMAGMVRRAQEEGVQLLVLAVGPADGWSSAALGAAERVVGFGRMTLPHELAAVVMAEQVYRALTILAGHPYHGGH